MPSKKRKPILPMTQERIDTFWSFVDKRGPNECWPWTAGKDTLGYGVFQARSTKGWNEPDKRNKRYIRAHRIMFAITHGYDPAGLVCHTCDNATCLNPAHLYEGTDTDNVWDRERRGRSNNPHQRLSREQVEEIRKIYPPPTGKLRPRGRWKHQDGTPRYEDIAKQYGVTASSIERIANRKIWKHLK